MTTRPCRRTRRDAPADNDAKCPLHKQIVAQVIETIVKREVHLDNTLKAHRQSFRVADISDQALAEGRMPHTYSADELAERVGIPAETLLDMAARGEFPHLTIAEGPPRFLLKPSLRYIKENLVRHEEGHPFKRELRIYGQLNPDIETVPAGLKELEHDLIRFPYADQPGVYFLIHKGEVVYVGATINLPARVTAHRISNKTYDDVLFLPLSTRSAAEALEGMYIQKLRPKYNVLGISKTEEEQRSIDEEQLSQRCLSLRRQIWYVIYSKEGRRYSQSTGTSDLRDACRFRDLYIAAVNRGDHRALQTVKLRQ